MQVTQKPPVSVHAFERGVEKGRELAQGEVLAVIRNVERRKRAAEDQARRILSSCPASARQSKAEARAYGRVLAMLRDLA